VKKGREEGKRGQEGMLQLEAAATIRRSRQSAAGNRPKKVCNNFLCSSNFYCRCRRRRRYRSAAVGVDVAVCWLVSYFTSTFFFF